MDTHMGWGTYADWAVATATLLLAIVAAFQDWLRARWNRPRLAVSARTKPPDCVAVPFTNQHGDLVAQCYYLRLRIQNDSRNQANNVEVYAERLQRRHGHAWVDVQFFPPMNLRWANAGGAIRLVSIPGRTSRHCDLGHITDPTRRAHLLEENPNLGLHPDQVSFAFDLTVAPNHKGHIIGPGVYRLDVTVTADLAVPLKRVVEIRIGGPWYEDEALMFTENGVLIEVP
jgi:hypothetical protein